MIYNYVFFNRMNMKMRDKLLLLFCFTGLMYACAPTTQIRKSWSDPSLEKAPVQPFEKVFVMVTAKKEEGRKAAEDQLVSLIKNGKAVQSYTYITPADTSQKELVDKLLKDGFDGAITMRVKAVVQTKTKYDSGTSYESWYSYGNPYGYGYGPGYGYGGGYVYSTTVTFDKNAKTETGNVDVNSSKDYIIETNIYSLKERKLLWAGTTASLSAKKVEPAMNAIYSTIRKELIKKGFLKD
jgi:hypothetical protein